MLIKNLTMTKNVHDFFYKSYKLFLYGLKMKFRIFIGNIYLINSTKKITNDIQTSVK